MQRFENKELVIFNPEDDKEADNDIKKDPTTTSNQKVMRYIIGIKHIFEIIITLILFLFYIRKFNTKFLRFKYCKMYVFVIYIVLLV